MSESDQTLVNQRNRIIEYMELAASFEEQRAYAAAESCAYVPNEVINQWEDWVPRADPAVFGPPVYSPDETRALMEFAKVWEQVADALPNSLPPFPDLQRLPAWDMLRQAAGKALGVMMVRGRFSDDERLFN